LGDVGSGAFSFETFKQRKNLGTLRQKDSFEIRVIRENYPEHIVNLPLIPIRRFINGSNAGGPVGFFRNKDFDTGSFETVPVIEVVNDLEALGEVHGREGLEEVTLVQIRLCGFANFGFGHNGLEKNAGFFKFFFVQLLGVNRF
jgi:hypothetical protein